MDVERTRHLRPKKLTLQERSEARNFSGILASLRGTIRAIKARYEDLRLVLSVLVGDGIDLVLEARTDKDRALGAERQRARVRHAAGIELEIEALRHFELIERYLVGGGRERRRRHRRELGGRRSIRPTADRRRNGP